MEKLRELLESNNIRIPLQYYGSENSGTERDVNAIVEHAEKTAHLATLMPQKKNKQFFNECAAAVEQFCADHGISCHIKEGTISK